MGVGSNSNGAAKVFLSVGFGKIRQKSVNGKKVDENTPGAICRETQSHAMSWAIEYDFIEGIIEKIFFKEDPQYGDSFEVVIRDVVDLYQVSFPEDSRYWGDLMKKLPNINLNQEVKLTSYDFEDKESHKRISGLSVEQNGEKIQSYYSIKKQDGTYDIVNGFPSSAGVDFKNDKAERNIYFIRVKAFLHREFDSLIAPQFKGSSDTDGGDSTSNDFTGSGVGNQDVTDDLPF